MTDIFEKYGEPNGWYTEDRLGYILDAQDNQLLYDLAVEDGFMNFVLEAIQEKYNRG